AIATERFEGAPADLKLSCTAGFRGAAGSRIDLGGDSNAGEPGANGGDLEIHSGMFLHYAGDIDTSGGDGTEAGHAGTVEIAAWYELAWGGALTAAGGNATEGLGGYGGDTSLSAEIGSVWMSGAVDTSGGDGATRGGPGGDIDVFIEI